MSMSDQEYVPKLSRSPDLAAYNSLPPDSKTSVSNLRTAMNNVYAKISTLKDTLDERDCELEEEQETRKVLEDRLKQFVDIYDNKELHQELNERLPKVQTRGIRVDRQSEDDKNASSQPFRNYGSKKPDSDSTKTRAQSLYSSEFAGPQQTIPTTSSGNPIWLPLNAPYPPFNVWTLPPGLVFKDPMQCKKCGHSSVCQKCGTEVESQTDNGKLSGKSSSKELKGIWLELAKMKEITEQIQERLDEAGPGHEVGHETPDASPDGKYVPGDISSLVENIYRAQVDRDEGVLERLNTAIRLKDKQLQQLEEQQQQPRETNMDGISNEHATRFIDTDKLMAIKDLQDQITASRDEKEALLNERAEILLKMQEVEYENLDFAHRLFLQGTLWQDTLEVEAERYQQLEDQTNAILAQFLQLKEELKDLEHSNGQLDEVEDTSSIGPACQTNRSRGKHACTDAMVQTQLTGHDIDCGRAHLQILRQERNQLATQLIEADKRLKVSVENQHKLERLVNVLRRKILGQQRRPEE